jgi:hypothetical protein
MTSPNPLNKKDAPESLTAIIKTRQTKINAVLTHISHH